jgi:hypothetical protein
VGSQITPLHGALHRLRRTGVADGARKPRWEQAFSFRERRPEKKVGKNVQLGLRSGGKWDKLPGIA